MKILEVARPLFFITNRGTSSESLSGFSFMDLPSLQTAIKRIEPYLNSQRGSPYVDIFQSLDYQIGAGPGGEDLFRNAKHLGHSGVGAGQIAQLVGFPPPQILYHVANSKDRQSILTYGLLRRKSETHLISGESNDEDPFGGIFFALIPTRQNNFDTWAVNVHGLHLVPDDTTEPEDPEDAWWVTWDEDVPPNRLRLMGKKFH